jgi:hypothetical protein
MVSVWVKKFIQDEDLCLVEYQSFRNAPNIKLPEISLCFAEPFIEEKLNGHETNTTEYLQFLSGDIFNEKLASINYTNVTFNFESYYSQTQVLYNEGSITDNEYGVINSRPNIFNFERLVKCYGFDVESSNTQDFKSVNHYFKSDPIVDNFMSAKTTLVTIHGPQQFHLTNGFKIVAFDANETYGGALFIQINKAEVLKTRNKPKNPCMMQWRNWDNLVTLKRIQDIGCLPPYYEPHPNFKICSTMMEIKRWHNVINEIKNNRSDLPCQQMPEIDFEISKISNGSNIKGKFMISIGYPEHVKVITQSRAVDVNTLIGNIGGYIGLFLGTV